jgi:D-tyrosyl-tRNA(Tyr) deacylase
MISVVQRVARASVTVNGELVGRIGAGLLALVCAAPGDEATDVEYTARRLLTLRIFPDEQDRMNRSVQEVGGAILVVSQFTLAGDTRKGRRPSFAGAARPEIAEPLVHDLIERLRDGGTEVAEGVFGAAMQVELVNDGPVTLLLDSRQTRRGACRESEPEAG